MLLKKLNRKWIILLVGIIVLGIVFVFLIPERKKVVKNEFRIKAAVVYSSESDSLKYKDTYIELKTSFVANMDVSLLDADKKLENLKKYDILYLDESLMLEDVDEDIIAYVSEGGNVFTPNVFLTYFEPEFFGAKKIVKVNSVPRKIVCPGVAEDFLEFQGIIKDFENLYSQYQDYETLSAQDYGYGIIPSTAKSIIEFDNLSLYGINAVGEGTVLYTNPMLPNHFVTSDENSRKTANRLILGEYASIISKAKYGYSVKRIFGTFGNPDMSLQVPIKDISEIDNNLVQTVGEMCKNYNIVPSFSLMRYVYNSSSEFEAITYVLNKNGEYLTGTDENVYSSGTHIIENNKYLSLAEVLSSDSFFKNDTSFAQRAYPAIGDYNNDGIADIVSGSSDGKFYYFEGESTGEEWKVKERKTLTYSDGTELSVSGYSAPVMTDIDYDGVLDLISGRDKGDILFFKGSGGMSFEQPKTLIQTIDLKKTMPSSGDINNDGRVDIVVGSVGGGIDIYLASEDGSYSYTGSVVSEGESFMAPCLYDYDKDGFSDIVYGDFYGNIKKMKNNQDNTFTFDGFYDTSEMSVHGNNHLKFGNNCVPRFYDINGDGTDDIIAGSLEYGFSAPIDSPYFLSQSKLNEQINYINENRFCIGMHFHINRFASEEKSASELNLHKQAMAEFNITDTCPGFSMYDGTLVDSGSTKITEIAKNAGFVSVSKIYTDSPGILTCPVFEDFEKKDFMITAVGMIDSADLNAKYNLPVCAYYSDSDGEESFVDQSANYKKSNFYNFVTENQLVRSSASAYNAEIIQEYKGDGVIQLSSKPKTKNFNLYDKNFSECMGFKIDFAGRIDASKVVTNADILRYDADKKDLYIGLNKKVSVILAGEDVPDGYKKITDETPHILGINVPAQVKQKDDKVTVKFKEGGMMQVTVFGEVSDVSEGWITSCENGKTIITKYGEKSTLTFSFK